MWCNERFVCTTIPLEREMRGEGGGKGASARAWCAFWKGRLPPNVLRGV